MPRLLSTVLAVLCLTTDPAAQSTLRPEDTVHTGIKHLERAEYAEALRHFEKAIDAYAVAQRLGEARRVYMEMFVGNRNAANVLMKAMKSWVERRRGEPGVASTEAFVEFDAWVRERDALATATINLVHNSPDWK